MATDIQSQLNTVSGHFLGCCEEMAINNTEGRTGDAGQVGGAAVITDTLSGPSVHGFSLVTPPGSFFSRGQVQVSPLLVDAISTPSGGQ